MSDEESFVILGTSPLSSIEHDGGGDRVDSALDASLHSDTPGSCFSSLKQSQIRDLKNASKNDSKVMETSSSSTVTSKESCKLANTDDIKAASITASKEATQPAAASSTMEKSAADSLLWSRPQVEVKDDFLPINLEDCAIQSPLEQSPKSSLHSRPPPSPLNMSLSSSSSSSNNKENRQPLLNNNHNGNVGQTTNASATPSKQNSLASSFIMGEINGDVLKTSVYSQFPSISMQASAGDVLKLQNLLTDYMQLKTTLEKVNNTMQLFYKNSLEWKEKMNTMESHYKQQLNDCQNQIEALRSENIKLKKSIEEQVEQTKAVDLARQKDRDDMIKTISEKSSLVENMRAQIVKLEQQNLASYEFLPKNRPEKTESNFDEMYITRNEHESIVKALKREQSELLAANLEIKDMEKQYIDELNCLKVNLTAAEELIQQNRAEIATLQASDRTKQNRIEELERSNKSLNDESVLQNERIILLEQQNEVHRKDFEMERESRQTAMGEKQQILQDLRALQKRNQELLEERQKLVDNYERRVSQVSSISGASSTQALVAAAAAAQSYINNPQRPIRELTPPSPTSQPVKPPASEGFKCPVCNKAFKSLSVLQSHVNDCIDRN
uniref:Putative polyubiquitin binding domain of nemo n=4 Tax=Haematobia irritans TaxID=7368 RepID=A0A1L8EJ38_HAEIR